jgi:beta-glucosidase/6-phospho-beta-glucosidase/beta-galactosidase
MEPNLYFTSYLIQTTRTEKPISFFSEKFGLFAVDFDDPARPRTPKESAKVLAEIIRTRQIPERFRED